MNYEDKKCDLYVEHIGSKEDLLDIFMKVIKCAVNSKYRIESSHMKIHVVNNSDYAGGIGIDDPNNGFLFYKYNIEIDPINESVNFEDYIEDIGMIMNSIWNAGGKVVAACDFEDLLPENGGKNSPKNL